MHDFGRFVIAVAFITVMSSWSARADDVSDAGARESVVKIFAKLRKPDLYRPWTKSWSSAVTGTGVVIPGKRILTNSHVVNYASEISIQPNRSSERIPAKIEVLSPAIDLAVLKLNDESFFEAHPALRQNPKLPDLQETALVYGYPEGGAEMSITRGIVSRVEFADYYMTTEGLRYLSSGNPPFTRYGERPAVTGERIVIVAHPMFTHRISKGYTEPYGDAIAEVNGTQIRNLKHMVEVLREATGEFVEFKFACRFTDTIVFNRKEALDSTEEVLNDNGIRAQCSADVAPI